MNNIVTVPIDTFLNYRNMYDLEFFAEADGATKVSLTMQVRSAITMQCSVEKVNPKYQAIKLFANKPNPAELLMVQSHNFADATTWEDPVNSAFTLAPHEGYKLYVNSILIRFPENSLLTDTPLSFVVNKYVPAYSAVLPVVSDSYRSLQELLVQSNTPWNTIQFDNPAIFSNKMIEIKFRYSDDDVKDWSKLSLSSRLGESIICSVGGTAQLVDYERNPLTDPAYAIFNTKRVLEF